MPNIPTPDSAPLTSTAHEKAGTLPEKFTPDEHLYSAQEVAERLGVSERWIRDHATRRTPRIRAVKLGPLLRFRWVDVEDFVAAQMTQAPLGTRGKR
jgi:excisionase family DNA binding protein